MNCAGTLIAPGNQNTFHKTEYLTINCAWDPTNDWSHQGLVTSGTTSKTSFIPVYDGSTRIWGEDPNGVALPLGPTVSLTSPVNVPTYSNPSNVQITATAAVQDSGASIKIEFYNGTTLLGSATSTPYQFTWTGAASGLYTLLAKAYDSIRFAK